MIPGHPWVEAEEQGPSAETGCLGGRDATGSSLHFDCHLLPLWKQSGHHQFTSAHFPLSARLGAGNTEVRAAVFQLLQGHRCWGSKPRAQTSPDLKSKVPTQGSEGRRIFRTCSSPWGENKT